MTYGEACFKAATLLYEGKNAYIVVSRIDGFYVATCRAEIGNGEVIQFVAPGPYQQLNLHIVGCSGHA